MKRRAVLLALLAIATILVAVSHRSPKAHMPSTAPDPQAQTTPPVNAVPKRLSKNGGTSLSYKPTARAIAASSDKPPSQLEAKFLSLLPPKLRSRADVLVEPSGLGIWSLSLAIDEVPVERTDVRAEKNAEGNWVFLQEPSVSGLADAPAVFPPVPAPEIQALIASIIEKESAELKAIRPAGRIWLAGSSELIPCGRFDVESVRNSDRLAREEIWCIHPSTREVIWRRSIRRR